MAQRFTTIPLPETVNHDANEPRKTMRHLTNGNRLSHDGMEAGYDDQDRMMTYGDKAYTYTVNGDILTKTDTQGTPDTADDELTTYTHDALGNLTSVTLPDDTVISYVYDGRNRLIAKKVNGTVDYRLIYAGQLAPVAKLAPNDSVIETYVYATGSNSPDYIIVNGSPVVKYRVVKDHLGSMRMIVKSDGTVMQQIEYNEFGIATVHYPSNTIGDIFGFAGGIRDTDTRLTKFGARWYDPETGRWLEKEPLGFAGSYNFYNYCDGDPVNYVDRTGLKPGDPFKTPDAAAIDAINHYLPDSVATDIEVGGYIVHNPDGTFSALPGNLGVAGKREVFLGPRPCTAIGSYHTHGSSGKGSFSNTDTTEDLMDDLTYGYLGTPSGRILKIDYTKSLQPEELNPFLMLE